MIFWMIVIGFLAGIIGGMGMGGGTILVPLMSFLDIDQKVIQSTNLISFLPMCLVALLLHNKNNLIRKKHVGWIILPAVAFSVLGALLGQRASNPSLRVYFGVFLVIVGLWQLIVAIKSMVKKATRKKYRVTYASVQLCVKRRR